VIPLGLFHDPKILRVGIRSLMLPHCLFYLSLLMKAKGLSTFCQTKKPFLSERLLLNRDPAGIRTQDPYIKSVMLYQLSYGIFYK
jgi:hypothetical protein